MRFKVPFYENVYIYFSNTDNSHCKFKKNFRTLGCSKDSTNLKKMSCL